jgi:hypothetical protein
MNFVEDFVGVIIKFLIVVVFFIAKYGKATEKAKP